MQTENTGNEIQKIIEIAWRRKWVILVPLVIIFTLVSLYGLYLPNQYRSSSSIFIEPQRVPTDYVRSTVTTDIEDRMRSITQQLTSRTKLLKVVKQLDLYPGMLAEGVPSEVLVARMRNDLNIEVPNRRDGNFFMVYYVHGDPTKAMLAVSNLVSLFIEESLQVRESQAEGTTLFIEEKHLSKRMYGESAVRAMSAASREANSSKSIPVQKKPSRPWRMTRRMASSFWSSSRCSYSWFKVASSRAFRRSGRLRVSVARSR